MKEELQRILGNWDYEAGLAWFKNHVQGKFFLKELFSKSKDAYNQQKLRQELHEVLQQLPDEHPQVLPAAKQKTPDQKPLLQLPKEVREELNPVKVVEQAASSPEEYQLDEEWKPLYKQAMYRRAQLREEMSEDERKENAFEVLNLMDQVQEIWEKKDFLKKYGHLPEFGNNGVEELTTVQRLTRIRTIRTYISKAKKGKLNAERIPEWEAEIIELERGING